MAISATTGAVVNNSSAGTSLAFASNTQTNGQLIVVCIAILAAGSVSVSSISDGVNTYTRQSAENNGSAVRIEIWTAPVTGSTASRAITVTFSGSTLASAAYEEYAGVSAIGNIGTPANGTGGNASGAVATQDSNNWAVTAVAVASTSGDTLTAQIGTKRQSTIPALTTAATALIDNSTIAAATLNDALSISASRAWAAATIELRTGTTATGITETALPSTLEYGFNPSVPSAPAFNATVPSFFNPVPVAANLQGGTTGVAYSETIGAQGGTPSYSFAVTSGSLPAGLSLNASTGVISGTPTTAGSSTFAITVTDVNSNTGTQSFTIVISAPSTGGMENYAYCS